MEKEKKLLQLMPDQKFIDYFIEQSEDVAPGSSDYWILQEPNESALKYVKSNLVTTVNWRLQNLDALINEAKAYEKIILHSFLKPFIKDFIYALDPKIPVVWMFWGADGYSFTPDQKRWFLPLTWRWKKKKKAAFRFEDLKKVYRNLFYGTEAKRRSRTACDIIRRVNVCATWVRHDFEMIKHINPAMLWEDYSYFTSDQLGLKDIEYIEPNFQRIWLGNSGWETNNHFDALTHLKNFNWSGEIVAPLSYGDPAYTKAVIAQGKRDFGERFIAITDFIPLNEYHGYLNSCGIVWMNHLRQQAAGNTLSALYMGKAVILNNMSNLYKTLKEWGIIFFNLSSLSNNSTPNPDMFAINKEIITSKLSYQHNRETIRKIYGSPISQEKISN